MATEIEYERTFLLKELPDGIENAKSEVIRDVYIPAAAAHPILRLRQKGDKFVITKKYPAEGDDSSKQYEHTIELSKEEFETMAACPNKQFIKTRYYMELAGRPAEVDLYHEELKGLAVIDFEFDNEEEKDNFVTPDFVLADVTQDVAVAGGYLAGKTIEEIMPLLSKYGYKKLETEL